MDFQLTGEQRELVAAMRELGTKEFAPDGFAPTGNGLPRSYLTTLADNGLAGITFPEEVGGQGGKLLDAVLVIETLAQISAAAGDAVQALNFGAIQQLARHGSDEQKEQFLSR